ncbi:hypothetical protein PR048_030255 [Dryococelus australis]|uniref:Uncharacterized protein n=1 Tax=Dryococelus australis TaxID=614101 RepID=A0ABQ9G8G5_9NEOP|nr:hypothetical protein PR048_030255 [Dryococelus australis]
MEQRRNARAAETGDPEKTRRLTASSGTISTRIRSDSARVGTLFALVGGEQSNRLATAAPLKLYGSGTRIIELKRNNTLCVTHIELSSQGRGGRVGEINRGVCFTTRTYSCHRKIPRGILTDCYVSLVCAADLGTPGWLSSERKKTISGKVTGGREVCDCEYQTVKCAAGRLDYWTRCDSHGSNCVYPDAIKAIDYCGKSLAVLPTCRESIPQGPSEPGSIPDGVLPGIFTLGNRAGRCHWPAGFLGILPFLPAPSSRCRPILTPFGYQALNIISRLNLLHSLRGIFIRRCRQSRPLRERKALGSFRSATGIAEQAMRKHEDGGRGEDGILARGGKKGQGVACVTASDRSRCQSLPRIARPVERRKCRGRANGDTEPACMFVSTELPKTARCGASCRNEHVTISNVCISWSLERVEMTMLLAALTAVTPSGPTTQQSYNLVDWSSVDRSEQL